MPVRKSLLDFWKERKSRAKEDAGKPPGKQSGAPGGQTVRGTAGGVRPDADGKPAGQEASSLTRRYLIFTGRVQGVGFRYRASNVARELGLTGWVRNEYDGSVAMEAQGTAEQIDRLIVTLMRGLYIEIDHVEQREMPVDPRERDFRVRGY